MTPIKLDKSINLNITIIYFLYIKIMLLLYSFRNAKQKLLNKLGIFLKGSNIFI
jgi:hypothetical protein